MNNRLVSVIIASFNSSPFIIETIESVSNQTWKELELIITDDCSSDTTVELCRNWLSKNRKRFYIAEILTSDKNTGISANANRGLYAAKGDWIKFLGADDTLKPDCIKDNMSFVASHTEIKALFSKVDVYNNIFEAQSLLETGQNDSNDPKSIMVPGRGAESQYKMLLISDRIHYSPSVFLHRETLLSVGGFDERFKMVEDYPLWLNLTKNGYKLFFMDKATVNYRAHTKAINNTTVDYLIKPNYFKTEDFRKIYTYPFLPADIMLNQRFSWYASQIFRINWLNRNKKSNKFLLSLLTVYLNPFKYLMLLRKRLIKNVKEKEYYE